MKGYLTATLTALLMVFFTQPLQGQTVEKLKLKRYYRTDNLDMIIDAIGKDMNIRFVYDKEHLHRYRMSVDPLSSGSKVKTVGAVLDILRYSWDMMVVVAEDGFIYIARDKEHLHSLQNTNRSATVQKQTLEHQKRILLLPLR